MVNGNSLLKQVELNSSDLELISNINSIREKGNLQTVCKAVGEKKIKSLLNKLYPAQDIKTLEKVLGVSDSSISYWFKSLGIISVRRHMSNRVYPASFNSSVVLPLDKTSINYSAIKIDSDLAYLIGFALGDGAVEKYSLEVFNKDLGMQQYLTEVMSKYGVVNKSVNVNGLWKLRLSSLKIANLVKQNKKINEDTLDFIFSDDLLAQNFLGGFWDAEGSVLRQANYFHVYLHNSNKSLMDKISTYFYSKGVRCSSLEMKKRKNNYLLNGQAIIAKKTVHRLSVKKKDMQKWAELIGLHLKHSKKSVVVKELLMERE